jgi:hypothetical protein
MSGANVSVAEFLAQSQRNVAGRIFGPDFLKKQTYLTVASTTFAQTYGRKIWDAMNNRTVTYNAIKKVAWGSTAGWVLRTDRGHDRMRPVSEVGTLPSINVSEYKGVYSLPKIIAADFGVPIKSIVVNTLEGGMGDILAAELQATERDFVKGVNQELLAGTGYLISAGNGTTTWTVPAAVAHNFKIGDTVSWWDSNDGVTTHTHRAVNATVSAVDTTTGVVTSATMADGGHSPTDGDVVYITSRGGITSLDDITSEDNAAIGGGSSANVVYNLGGAALPRTAAGPYAGGYVGLNAGVLRPLKLELLDDMIEAVRLKGGEPKLITMGWDQYFNLERLLAAHQRYMGQETFQVGVGDERTLPGTRTGLVLSTYMGIPILPDVDTAKSVATDDTVGGSNVYMWDTDYIEIAVAMQPQYIENRDFFAATAMVVRGLVYMMAETRVIRPDVQAKIGDLS